ncbi:carboxymuconolactone decarboxylase family protein [Pseudonocardia sp. RS010]|uniref:carboxymuconolactone decarboxylase family protein n=1 Tax=Pseudonocardia sp. RS010 TaxID=3385979 RepID=UPI0039A3B181
MTEPEDLARRRRAVREAILGGPRAAGPQHFDLVAPDGTLHGPFELMVEVPGVGGPLQALGAAIRYETSLTGREREIAVLVVARVTGSAFERYAHERIGRAIGLTEDEIEALRRGRPAVGTPREQEIAALSAHLATRPELAAADRAEQAPNLDDQTVIEVTVLAGYYRILAQMMELAGIGAPPSSLG